MLNAKSIDATGPLKHMSLVSDERVEELLAKEVEYERLRDALIQIEAVANDNKSASCDQGMALSFVRMAAAKALTGGTPMKLRTK